MEGVHVVLGASGGAGSAVVRELVSRGHTVRAVSRSGSGSSSEEVEVVRGDLTDFEDAKQVCKDAEVVYNCVNVPYQYWLRDFPRLIQGSIEGAASAGAKLVFCDNLYMYGPVDEPVTEKTLRRARGRKGKLRAELEQTLLNAHKSGEVRVTIGRGADFYGPYTNSVTKDFVFGAVLGDKKARWPVSLDTPHSLTYTEDFARGLVTLGEREEALGEVWHVPAAKPITGREFITLAFRAADKAPKMTTLSPFEVRLGGLFSPLVREFAEVTYQFERPFIIDGSKFRTAFGLETTPHAEAIARTLEAYSKETENAQARRLEVQV